MYPSLQVGPISLPTAQILALVAAWFGLSVMAQVGRRLRLDPDMVWNLGTLALAAGLIVARLSHAVQYWSIYRAEPLLLVSIRPGGLLFWPGAIGALAAGYLYLIRKGVDPRPVGTAVVMGVLAGGAVLEVSYFLTGSTVGVPGTPPEAVSSALTGIGRLTEPLRLITGEVRHPVALYRAIGMMLIVGGLLLWGNWKRSGRLAGQALLALALLRLLVDGFAADASQLGPLRISQLVALVAALALALSLAGTTDRDRSSPGATG